MGLHSTYRIFEVSESRSRKEAGHTYYPEDSPGFPLSKYVICQYPQVLFLKPIVCFFAIRELVLHI